jgi:hypothetical protein
MTQGLHLRDIWTIPDTSDYKLHFARWNSENQPLDVYARSFAEWQGWQEYRPSKDEFNRQYIFSMIQFYHEPSTWLFGGVWNVVARHPDRYEVALDERGSAFLGRLKLVSTYKERSPRVNFENHYDGLLVKEILAEPYSGRVFPGFDNIDVSFEELEALVKNGRPDWKAALANVKGVYMITDVNTNKRYIGSAYGTEGIWSRWSAYVADGHGGNVELRKLATADPMLGYCRTGFRFTLLEYRPAATPDELVIGREGFWKRVLLSRGEMGLNRN